jgi:hypothetical protein
MAMLPVVVGRGGRVRDCWEEEHKEEEGNEVVEEVKALSGEREEVWRESEYKLIC